MRHLLALRFRAVLLAFASALPVNLALAGGQDSNPVDDNRPAPALVSALVEAHNKERAKEKLPPLKSVKLLEDAAIAHSIDQAEHGKMTHEGTDGTSPQQRIVRAGYHYQNAGENVAHGYDGVASVMQGWMDSPPHKKNVLGDFTEIGIARVEDKDGHPYWTVDFGKPYPKFDPATAATEVIKALNAERTTASKPLLTADPRLTKAAEIQAAALAKAMGKGPPSDKFSDLDEKKYRELAMSVASGHPDAPTLVKTLIASPDHKTQLLEKFTRVGVGYATAEDGVPYWAIILAIPAGR